MKIAIGPKGRQIMLWAILGYHGYGKRWGHSHSANGRSLRFGQLHLMIWWPRGNDLGSEYVTN